MGGFKRPPGVRLVLGLLLVCGCAPEEAEIVHHSGQPVSGHSERMVKAQEKQTAESVMRNLYKQNFADDVDNRRPIHEPKLARSGFLYNRLNGKVPVRKLMYPISDRVIKKEFNKPGTPDAVPRIDQATLAKLQKVLQPGDIILCGNNDSFVHAIVYLGHDQIIHALAQLNDRGQFLGTVKETLTRYVARVERDKFVVLRKPGLKPEDVSKMSHFAHSQLGKSYDSMFLLNTRDRYYCTEMVYHTLQALDAPPRIYPHKAQYGWYLFTNEDLMDTPDLQTVWSHNYTRPPTGKQHDYL